MTPFEKTIGGNPLDTTDKLRGLFYLRSLYFDSQDTILLNVLTFLSDGHTPSHLEPVCHNMKTRIIEALSSQNKTQMMDILVEFRTAVRKKMSNELFEYWNELSFVPQIQELSNYEIRKTPKKPF